MVVCVDLPGQNTNFSEVGFAYMKRNSSYVRLKAAQSLFTLLLYLPTAPEFSSKKPPPMPALDQYLKDHRDRFLEELLDFLRIPSVSAQPHHNADVLAGAEFVKTKLLDAVANRAEAYKNDRASRGLWRMKCGLKFCQCERL